MLKRFLAVALAMAMILGLASTAFAATFSDTEGHEREAAVKLLASLDLLKGYEDGTFKPEGSITRAEFAAVICRALGLEDAAGLMQGLPTTFGDVAAEHWASGYINIATSQEIINGYPDGTFGPERNVTYAEALAMILRALGYEPMLKGGVWPTVYVLKAADLKISKGVSFSANANATRGDVAELVSNSLTVPLMVQEGAIGGEITWKVDKTQTLLSEKLEAKSDEGILTASPDLFTVDEDAIELDGERVLTLADGVDVTGLLGHKVKAWIADKEVFYVDDLTADSEIKEGKVVGVPKGYDEDDKEETDPKKIAYYKTVVKVDKTEYTLKANVFVNYGGKEPSALAKDDEVTVIFDGKNAVAAVALKYDYAVVKSVNRVGESLSFKPTGSLRLKDVETAYFGDASKLSEIKEDDVVQYIKVDDRAVVIVTRDSLTGKLTRLTGAKATVAGKAYDLHDEAVYDTDDLGDTVVALFDKDGNILRIEAVEASKSSDLFAVVTNAGTFDTKWEKNVPVLELFTADGDIIEVECSDVVDVVGDDLKYDNKVIEFGWIIEYTLDEDGVLDAIDSYKVFDDKAELATEIDGKSGLIRESSSWQRVSANTIVFDLRDVVEGTSENWQLKEKYSAKKLSIATLSDLYANDKIAGAIITEGAAVQAVAIYSGTADYEDTYYGYLVDDFAEAKDIKGVVILADGTETEYVIDDKSSIPEVDIVSFKMSGSKIVSLKAATSILYDDAEIDDTEDHEWRITKVKDGIVTVTAYWTSGDDSGEKVKDGEDIFEVQFLADKDSLFYEKSGKKVVSIDIDDISLDSVVDVYEDDSIIKVLFIKN